MQINDALNLVIPLQRDGDGNITVYGYHTPISREVFEANYAILASTKAALFSKGLAYAADVGPRIAALKLRDEARAEAISKGDVDANGEPRIVAATALLAEMRRLTMALVPGDNGWEMIPAEIAVSRKAIDAEDWREAESGLVFFTCAYAMAPRANRAKMAEGLASVLGGLITSSPLTEYAASLRTSTQAETTAKPVASSVPS